MRQPNLWSPAQLIQARRFERPHGNTTAQDNDRSRLFQRVFDAEPATDVQEQHRERGDGEEYNKGENPGGARTRSLWRVGVIQDWGREWVVGKHGKTGC